MKHRKPYIVRAIYRATGGFPIMRSFYSLTEIWELLGSVPLGRAEVDGDLYVIYRADARENGEPRNFCWVSTEGDDSYIQTVYGDAVLIGFDSKTSFFKSLTPEQLERILFSPEGIA